MNETTLDRWEDARDYACSWLAPSLTGRFADWYLLQAYNRPLGDGRWVTTYPGLSRATCARFLTVA